MNISVPICSSMVVPFCCPKNIIHNILLHIYVIMSSLTTGINGKPARKAYCTKIFRKLCIKTFRTIDNNFNILYNCK